VIREPSSVVSAAPPISYQAPPAAPSNAGYTIVPVADPWRGTSTKIFGPFHPFVLAPSLSWQPTFVQPGRPILRAAGTDHVKDVWRFLEAVSADKWQATIVQPVRSILRASGTSSVDRLLELVFADKWQPTVVQPIRAILRASGTSSVDRLLELVFADKWQPTIVQPGKAVVRAKGTDSVLGQELLTADKWLSTMVQPSRRVAAAKGTDLAEPLTVGIFMSNGICNGRLTLTSGDPIDSSATGTTLYFTPYFGNYIGLFDGISTWNFLKFSELSIAVPAPTGLYDLFAYNNGGAVALEFGNIWTSTGNNTASPGVRNQALVLQDGVYVKSGATTRRYLGTIYSSSGTTSDTLAARQVWNYYNRINKKFYNNEITSYTYNTNAWRAANGNANGVSLVTAVVGIKENVVRLFTGATVGVGSGTTWYTFGVGYDSTTSGVHDIAQQPSAAYNGALIGFTSLATHFTDIGYHSYYWIENCSGGGLTNTVYPQGPGNPASSGIAGDIQC
jgi:hypothetical protein